MRRAFFNPARNDMTPEHTRAVYVVYQNTDLTEGRGQDYPVLVCAIEATARRFAKGAGAMGSDSRVVMAHLIQVDGVWYAPPAAYSLQHPSREDQAAQVRLDAVRAAEAKARAAGLTDAELATLRSS